MMIQELQSLAQILEGRLEADLDCQRQGPGETLPTPHVQIDVATMLGNLWRMQAYVDERGLGLRPHIKTHKSSTLARLQLDLGAIGLTSAKPSEAEAVAAVATDLLLAYPCFTPDRLDTLARLATSRRVRIAVDSSEAIQGISQGAQQRGCEFGLLIDLDVGHHRTGVQATELVLRLAQEIKRSDGVSFDGLLYFPGHLVPTKVDLEEGLLEVHRQLRETIEVLANAGLRCGIVSGGSTPSSHLSHRVPELTEIRPGTYIFNDLNSVRWRCAELGDCAATVHATVISTAVAGKAVIDAGSKMLSSDVCGATPDSGYGFLIDHPKAKLARLSEEHGEIELGEADWSPRVGERVRIIPNHVCPVVNLQDTLSLRFEGDHGYAIPVDGRGRTR